MRIHHAALLGTVAFALGCVDHSDPVGIKPPEAPLRHVPIGGQSALTAGFGTATIDGVFSPGEWANAGVVNFAANVPAADGGGTTPATLYALNDGTNLYLALKIARTSFGEGTNPFFEFDNDHSGGPIVEGDDVIGMSVGRTRPLQFFDSFRTFQPPCPAGFLCGVLDTDVGGTSDGATAAFNDGTYTYIELAHPLDDADDAHDFSLKPGDVVGFQLSLRLGTLEPVCGPGCFADTFLPTESSFPSFYADLQLALVVIPVNIDVKPGSDVTSLNLRSNGKTPVAILSTSTFDATAVDPSSVLFAGASVARRPDGTYMAGREDVNGDGRPDLLVHVETTAIQLGTGVVEAVLTAQTFGGQNIKGSEWVRVLPH